jgi:alpha-tubulin suppressor-like RCC1 family protein
LTEFCKRDPAVLGCGALGSDQKYWPGPSDSFSNTRDIAVGSHFACVLDEGGTPLCYDEYEGHLATLGASDKFVAIEGVPPLVEIDAGLHHVCGRSEAGEVWCWGSNEYGQLGDGTTQSHRTTPVRVGSFPALDQLALDLFTISGLSHPIKIWICASLHPAAAR